MNNSNTKMWNFDNIKANQIWNWQHAKNVNERWLVNDIDINLVGEWDSWIEWIPNIVIVSLDQTKNVIENIIKNGNKSKSLKEIIDSWEYQEIINCAWIMNTTPEEIIRLSTNLHFLFWPNAKDNLRVIFAGQTSKTVNKILDNCRKNNIDIVLSDPNEHDEMMAKVQWLTHMLILLSWINFDWSSELTKEWNTPSWTIADMIDSNPFFRKISKEFFHTIRTASDMTKVYKEIIMDNMTSQQVKDFSTPTFKRVLDFCNNNSIHTNINMFDFINYDLKDRYLLEERIKEIQKVEDYKILSN